MRTSERNGSLSWAAAVVGPVLAAGLLSFGRGADDKGPITATNAALVLVVVVIVIASTGNRWMGSVAAIVAGAAFDFFWTSPYLKLVIDDPADIQTAVLLVVAGVVVSHLAWWGRRHQAEATARSGYLDRVRRGVFAESADAAVDRMAVEQSVAALLGADRAIFVLGRATSDAVLHPDGSVTRGGTAVDVARHGLPTDVEVVVATPQQDQPEAHVEVVAAGRVARPNLAQRQAAVILAAAAAQRVLAAAG